MRHITAKLVSAAAVMVLAVALAGCSSGSGSTNNGTDNSLTGMTETKITQHIYENNEADTVQEFETATFGNYQGNAIEWLVLDQQDGKTLLLSKDVLDAQPFDDGEVLPFGMQNIRNVNDVTWANCSLRTWLNGSFFQAAFSADEQGKIADTTLSDSRVNASTSGSDPLDQSQYHVEETTDKVFLLSTREVKDLMVNMDARVADATDYAKSQGAYTGVSYNNGEVDELDGKYSWWLRTPGYYAGYAAVVLDSGEVEGDGFRVDGQVHDGFTDHGTEGAPSELGGNFGIRPAIWVDDSALA